ncbi:MAG: hypothetical protein NTV80_13985 [Verrucomicrobia bacterium]|nr:hypothetical protein [Verrucomicrobiota bacterium]
MSSFTRRGSSLPAGLPMPDKKLAEKPMDPGFLSDSGRSPTTGGRGLFGA